MAGCDCAGYVVLDNTDTLDNRHQLYSEPNR